MLDGITFSRHNADAGCNTCYYRCSLRHRYSDARYRGLNIIRDGIRNRIPSAIFSRRGKTTERIPAAHRSFLQIEFSAESCRELSTVQVGLCEWNIARTREKERRARSRGNSISTLRLRALQGGEATARLRFCFEERRSPEVQRLWKVIALPRERETEGRREREREYDKKRGEIPEEGAEKGNKRWGRRRSFIRLSVRPSVRLYVHWSANQPAIQPCVSRRVCASTLSCVH